MANSLETRFHQFLRQLPGAESVDDLPGSVVQGRRRADYLLRSRTLIVEVKSLEADPADKVEAVVAAHRDRPDFPLFYGEVELKKVLAHLPVGMRSTPRSSQGPDSGRA